MTAVAIAMPLALSSCGGDDDDDDSSSGGGSSSSVDYNLTASGSLTFTPADGSPYTRKVSDAGFKIWSTDSYDTPTLDVYVTFDLVGTPADVTTYLSNNGRISKIYAAKQNVTKLEKGMTIYPERLFYASITKSGTHYNVESKQASYSGTVTITKWEAGKYLHVKFSNCKYEINTTNKGTFSGEVKCPIRRQIP